MDQIDLDPMTVMQAQHRRLSQLLIENVQLEAAVEMLQAQVEALMQGEVPENNGEVTDVTDEVVGAEITS